MLIEPQATVNHCSLVTAARRKLKSNTIYKITST